MAAKNVVLGMADGNYLGSLEMSVMFQLSLKCQEVDQRSGNVGMCCEKVWSIQLGVNFTFDMLDFSVY